MDQPKHKIRLNEILEKTSTTVALYTDGRIVVDHYDFSSDANSFFGKDVAYILIIPPSGTALLHGLLTGDAKLSSAESADVRLLELIQIHFQGYHDFKNYLENNNIPLEKKFDSWA